MERSRQKSGLKNRIWKKAGIVLFWLLIWQVLALCVGNRILLAGPSDVIRAWILNLQKEEFLLTCMYSVGRIGLGVLLGLALGTLLGCFAYKFKVVRELLAPLMVLLKSVPVAAFVVLLLIWWGAKGLSVAIVFIVVMPLIYTNTVQGLLNTDKKMLEMAVVFNVPFRNRFFYIYRPALRPFMESGLKIALGMSWKSGVAAEVIGIPEFSIGEQMYMSKIYLDTAGLFAWTGIVILLSVLFERAGLYLWKQFCLWKPGFAETLNRQQDCQQQISRKQKGEVIVLKNVCKAFDGKPVLQNVNQTLESGKIYCLMAPSGEGKTTLLRVLAGLETAESGEMPKANQEFACSFGFQEDRLAEDLTATENIMLVCGSRCKSQVRAQLEKLLPAESLLQTCSTFSGGMKRRVSLVRAVLAESDVLLLDEPFTGLDDENKRRAAAYLLDYQRGRTVVVATHDETDVKLLDATLWKL